MKYQLKKWRVSFGMLKLKYILILLIISFCTEGWLFIRYNDSTKLAQDSVDNTHKVIEKIEELYATADRLILGLQGVMLKDLGIIPDYKFTDEPWIKNPQKLKESVQSLQELIHDNPLQQKNITALEILMQREISLIKQTMSLNSPERPRAFAKIFRNTKSGYLLDEIKVKTDEMVSYEKKQLVERKKIDQQFINNLVYFMALIGAITYLLFIWTVTLLFSYLEKSKMIEEQLRDSESRLNRAVSGTSDGLWDWNITTDEVYYSPRLKEMLGYNEDEMENTVDAFTSLFHPDDQERVIATVRAHLVDHEPYCTEFQLRKKDGSYAWLLSRGQAVWDDLGIPIQMSGFITDITQRKNIERMKNEFISTVSHELRTPLTSIRGSLGLMLAGVGGSLSEKGYNLIDIAHKNCERLIILINDILDIEKIESGQTRLDFQWVGVKSLIKQAVELNHAYADKYQVKFLIADPLPEAEVYVDSERFLQVMTNLISNAAKYSPAGQSVEISATEYGNYIRTSIKDHGPGIPEEFRSRIFGKFSQADSSIARKKGGTGLGLNISKTIIELFGGKIGFDSTDEGTTFFVDLPKVPAAEISQHVSKSNNQRLLICEDDIDTAHMLQKNLQKQAYDVDIAFNASQALTLLNSYDYAAMTLDLVLPDKNGIDLIQEIRGNKKTQNLPIIVVSAKADEIKQEINGTGIGVIDWLTKPIDQKRLHAAIKKVYSSMKKPVVLYVEDDKDLVKIITYNLSETADVVHASSLAQAQEFFSKDKIDLVILDITLPDGSGLKLLRTLDGIKSKPVIIFSASEVSHEISAQVSAALVKSRTSDKMLVSTIKSLISQHYTQH